MGRYRTEWMGRPVSLGGLSRYSGAMAVSLTLRVMGGREDGRRIGVPMTADEAEAIGLNLVRAAAKLREWQELQVNTQGPFWEPPEEE